MAKWLYTHRREIILCCLLLILMAFVGHFLADATGLSLHSPATVDLHGNFLLTFVAKLYAPHTATIIDVLPLTLFQFCTAPPTPPPPISLLIKIQYMDSPSVCPKSFLSLADGYWRL